MPYIKVETIITVNKHLRNIDLKQVGRLLGQSLGRNKDHADLYVFKVSAGKLPEPLLTYLQSINAPHAVESGRRWQPAADNTGPAAGLAGTSKSEDHAAFGRHLHGSIVRILRDNGESFLADRGVDEKVCRRVADEILEALHGGSIRVLVAVRGGCVQGALADLPNITLEVHDFNVFDTQAKDDQGRTKQQSEQDWDMTRSRLHTIY